MKWSSGIPPVCLVMIAVLDSMLLVNGLVDLLCQMLLNTGRQQNKDQTECCLFQVLLVALHVTLCIQSYSYRQAHIPNIHSLL